MNWELGSALKKGKSGTPSPEKKPNTNSSPGKIDPNEGIADGENVGTLLNVKKGKGLN